MNTSTNSAAQAPVVAKKKLTTSAMIASIASEGQATRPAPFGHALAALAEQRADIVPKPTRIVFIRWAWPSSC
jgi:transketolase